jgi:timeless protein
MGDNAILGEEQLAGSSLGYQVGDHYKIHEHTAEVLESINKRLNDDDKTLRPYRRALTFSQIIQKDLVPILISSSNEIDIFDSVVRLMVNITLPVECLFPMEVVGNSEAGKEAVFELNHSLRRTKELYRDSRTTRPIMERLCLIVSKHIETSSGEGEVTVANNCLLLLRNILRIPVVDTSLPNNPSRNGKCSIQNQIMWNLFSQNLDKILLDLINHSLSGHWSTAIMQLICLVYKDQPVQTLQQLLQSFLESTMSDSSEDNESNTSPQEVNGSCSSDLRSLEHSDDSSDNSASRSSPGGMQPRRKESNKRCY